MFAVCRMSNTITVSQIYCEITMISSNKCFGTVQMKFLLFARVYCTGKHFHRTFTNTLQNIFLFRKTFLVNFDKYTLSLAVVQTLNF